jgi:D-proline reductase (dithiol) PrdB
MDFIPYVPKLTERYRSLGFPNYNWSVYDTSPFTPVKKPLEESCISLIASSGIFRDDQEPFEPNGWPVNEVGIRLIPKETDVKRLKMHYNYYDHRDAVRDINCVFPLERLRELEEEGVIGRLAPSMISLGMGRTYKRSLIFKTLAPKIAEILHEQGVDGALVVSS